MSKHFIAIAGAVVALGLVAAGCAARPELPARSGANPAGVDLTGNWELRRSGGEPPVPRVGREEGIRIPPASASRRTQQGPVRAGGGKRSKSPSVQVFIENGRSLKITQTDHGLFVSYDRAVVEEYTFGENRMVSLGPIEAQRVSGWEGAVFVVETMDERGATLTETWTLSDGGIVLARELVIADGDKQLFTSMQIFDRT